jgi:Asp-tRNA(Asn)/Glu-tRNA(Gln) amidotransferase A subunit family amidase
MSATPEPARLQLSPRGYLALTPQLRAGQVTPTDHLEACLAAIERLEPGIGAFVRLAPEAARRAAGAASARWRSGHPLSPIDGMPIAVKDIIETIDLPTGQGSPLWAGTVTQRDAASVRALREAGAIIIGKATTTEFAASATFAATRNPHDATRTPGGSSSGSAAAVGAGLVPAALGTQVVGSILRPASFCGCVGFKPSVGALNRGGSYDVFSQSCQGVLAASLADAWAVARAIADRVGGDPGYVGLSGQANLTGPARPRRLALLETGGWAATSAGARQAFATVCERLAGAGIELVGRADDPAIETLEGRIAEALTITRQINEWEGRWPLNTYAARDASQLSASARERLRNAEALTQADYRALLGQRQAARTAFAEVAARYDAALTLAAPGAAPTGLTSTGNPAMNVAASLLGTPALALPLLADEGLPLGLQLIGGAEADAALFELAAGLLQQVLERPDLVGTAES